MSFAEKLDNILIQKKMKHCQLAEVSGLTPAAISKILSSQNEPRWSTAQKIIQAFPDIDLRYWLDENPCEKEDKSIASKLAKLSKKTDIFNDDMIKLFGQAAKIIANK